MVDNFRATGRTHLVAVSGRKSAVVQVGQLPALSLVFAQFGAMFHTNLVKLVFWRLGFA